MSNTKARTLAGSQDYNILLEPVITEKSTRFSEAGNRVVLRVPCSATKTDIRRAVERVFNVKVESVNTVSILGKTKRTARGTAKKSNFKKAYVTLAEGQNISVVEGL